MYEINLIDTTRTYVVATTMVNANDRDDALQQRPADWPISRTKARAVRFG